MTDASLQTTFLAPTGWPDRWLADAAVRRGLPGADRLSEHESLPTAWEALVAAGATEDAILALACAVSATKAAELSTVGVQQSALLDQAIAERHGVVPVRADGTTLVVATANPLSETLEGDLAFATRRRVHIVTASPSDVEAAMRRCYGAALPFVEPSSAPRTLRKEHDDDVDAPSAIAQLIDALIQQALRDGASDLHFEPKEEGLLVRFRVDGSLYEVRRVPAEQSSQVVRRIKVLAGMDIADTMRPQDGRLAVQFEGR
ncbi:MAG TPA: ATPase, T2SS/T4P/T4SS family, partial [Gemmatimonadaceae bacterium]|nr:ATPase, T2SS/T4P/T4SS family [Gemmatimonadaceae bacterium]